MDNTLDNAQQERFMALALQASTQALPHCLPNPPVGCVLVRNMQVIATGYTREPGHFHAEADALSQVSGSLRDVSAFVTLEPCSFHGRTPSCAKTLVERGISIVYVGLTDPDARNNGNGLQILREAGIPVVEQVHAAAVSQFLQPFLRVC